MFDEEDVIRYSPLIMKCDSNRMQGLRGVGPTDIGRAQTNMADLGQITQII